MAAGIADALVLPTDVTNPDQVEAAFAAVDDRWGRVDLLVNNAGRFGASGHVDEIPVEEWLETVSVNLTGSFLCGRTPAGADVDPGSVASGGFAAIARGAGRPARG